MAKSKITIARVKVPAYLMFDVVVPKGVNTQRGTREYLVRAAANELIDTAVDSEEGFQIPVLPHGRIYPELSARAVSR